MQNGQWMRAAIFAYLFRVEKDILEERDRQYG
jgi:hypothetical protein